MHIRYVLIALLHRVTNVRSSETAVRRNRSMCRESTVRTPANVRRARSFCCTCKRSYEMNADSYSTRYTRPIQNKIVKVYIRMGRHEYNICSCMYVHGSMHAWVYIFKGVIHSTSSSTYVRTASIICARVCVPCGMGSWPCVQGKRPCLLGKNFGLWLLYHFCFYLTNIIKLWSN